MPDIRQAIEYAKNNPNSPYATELRRRIESGQMDTELSNAGIPLPSDKSNSGFIKNEINRQKEILTGTDRTKRVLDIINKEKSGDQGIGSTALQLGGEIAKGAIESASNLPVIRQGLELIGKGINSLSETAPVKKVGDKIEPITSKIVNWFNSLSPEEKANVSATANILSIIPAERVASPAIKTLLSGVDNTISGAESVSQGIKTITSEAASGVKTATKEVASIAKDVIPSSERITNSQIAKAFDLTQGDVRKIKLATGNDIGDFVASNQLIGDSIDSTTNNINKFFEKNYNEVRDTIKSVDKTYKPSDVPRYDSILKKIKTQINDVTGLEDVNKEVDKLISKKKINLSDVQRVKELLDEHFSLYNSIGDVGQSVEKSGLANARNDIKKFIEREVKDATGVDISLLNNNVATSKTIIDAIESRSTRGLTRSHLSAGDLGLFIGGTASGSPLTGVALVFGNKILKSPTLRLKIAKYFSKINESTKANIAKDLSEGVIPDSLNKAINK